MRRKHERAVREYRESSKMLRADEPTEMYDDEGERVSSSKSNSKREKTAFDKYVENQNPARVEKNPYNRFRGSIYEVEAEDGGRGRISKAEGGTE